MTIPSRSIPEQYPLRDIPTPYIYSNHENNSDSNIDKTNTAVDNGNILKKRRRTSSNDLNDQNPFEIKRSKIDSEKDDEKITSTMTLDIGAEVPIVTNPEDNVVTPSTEEQLLTIDEVKDGIVEEALPISPVASASGDRTPQDEITTALTAFDKDIKPSKINELMMYCCNNLLDKKKNTTGTISKLTEQTSKDLQCLAFQFIAQLNRAQLTDINAIIRDNLKRDLISTLPIEIALKILAKLDFPDIVSCLTVSPHWNHIIETTPFIWKHLLISENFISYERFPQYIEEIKAKYQNLSNFEDAYKPDFLKRTKTLRHWYDPKFIPQRTTLKGHMTSVVTCLQSADDYIITGADDKMIRVYSTKMRKFLLELGGHEGGVWALKYDRDGILVSGSTDRSVRIWDIKRGCCLYVFKGHTSTVRCLDIVEYKNNKYIVTGSRDNTLHVWKLCKSIYNRDNDDGVNGDSSSWPIVYDSPDVNPYFVGVLKGHVASVRTISGYGNIVISGSYDNTLMVWDIAQMKCLYILSGHTDRIYSTIYDHKRQRCISASMDSTVRVWDLKHLWRNGIRQTVTCAGTTCTRVTESYKVLSGHTALVGLLKLSDKYLISAAADGTLKGWDADDYSLKFSYLHSNLSAITTFHMDDNILVSGSERQFNIYNLRTGNLVHSNLLRDAEQIWSVTFKDNLLVAAVEKNNQSSIEMLDFA
ncbi:SCF ubiquitin ligase complex subunit cdc4 [Maudiozyma exigua]|uniref:SCF ubiquitin ligase complex subunit cdc4 n=1 Tax=Maudiozyma exigua TaxID=34358 RepID=A0A9P6WCA0_MAUEX|nr:SCF ubiquitin ligase complex subunit cdc4 [Kazachstania exigua]